MASDPYAGPIPNLPGYQSSPRRTGNAAKKSGLRVVNGYAIDVQIPADTGLKRELTDYAALKAAAPRIAQAPEARMPKWMAEDKQVLCFQGYFKEAVTESNDEAFRVRKVVFYYYLEDDTLHISEPKIENSGIPQGTFVKRHKVKTEDGNPVKGEDLLPGRNVTIYGRTFHVVDCDGHTRGLLTKAGFNVKPAEPYPEDPYGTSRSAFMARETGADPTVYRGILSNPTKDFVEAQLGNAAKNNRKLGDFLEHDKKVLRFDAVWDDKRDYGKLRRFKMHFYLTDGTIEIIEKFENNSGFDETPKLMDRQKFLKKPTGTYLPPSSGALEDMKPEDFIQWGDLHIGKVLECNGRQIEILDADGFTRDFYTSQGAPLGSPRTRSPPAKQLARELEPPPHTGIGTEEDSAASWHSLHPKPPRRDLAKLQKYDNKALTFTAKLNSDRADDRDRVFAITYFLGDDTISVFEPPIRNTGIIGGKFLRRGKYKNKEGNYFHFSDLKVHTDVVLGGFSFHIADVDEGTQKFLDSAGMRSFSSVNIKSIITKLVLKLRRKSHTIQKVFRELDEDKNNYITMDEMSRFLKHYFSHDELNDDECLMVMKFFDTDGEGRIDYNEFAAKIIGKDVGVSNYQSAATDDMGDTAGGGADVHIDEDELQRYMAVARAAQAADAVKSLVSTALKEFQTKSDALSKEAILSEFRLYDRRFDNTITLADFRTILTHTLTMDDAKADAVISEITRRLNVTGDVLTFAQYRSSFKVQ